MTSIIGTESVDIDVAGNTHIKGAVIANVKDGVDKGNLHLSTGTLSFEDIYDSDKSKQTGIGVSYSGSGTDAEGKTTGVIPGVASGSYSSSNTQGVTRATIGEGEIEITDGEGQEQDVAELNRDAGSVQTITKNEDNTYSLAIPLTTPEKVKNGVENIKNASIQIGNNLDRILSGRAETPLESKLVALIRGSDLSAEEKGRILAEVTDPDNWEVGPCGQTSSLWHFFIAEAYAAPEDCAKLTLPEMGVDAANFAQKAAFLICDFADHLIVTPITSLAGSAGAIANHGALGIDPDTGRMVLYDDRTGEPLTQDVLNVSLGAAGLTAKLPVGGGVSANTLDWSVVSKSGESRIGHINNQHGNLNLNKPNQGIFYGDPKTIIDDAWGIAQKQGIQPVTTGGVDIYVVPRPNSGYAGGYSGQLQNLDTTTIITQHGTNKIITGFPGNGIPLPQ